MKRFKLWLILAVVCCGLAVTVVLKRLYLLGWVTISISVVSLIASICVRNAEKETIMSIHRYRKNFDDCLELVRDKEIREFTRKALQEADPKFWTAPCSSSGKYHPPEDQVEGGVIIHSRKAVRVVIDLFSFFDIQDQLAKDKIIAAVILHDICKYGMPWGERTDYTHGHIAAKWLQQFIPENKEATVNIKEVIDLIANHMGIWNKPEPTPAITKGSVCGQKEIMHLIIQLADYWASRKWCSFVCNEID